mgnify:CR=1 FL=1
MSRKHNNTNVLTFGARVVGVEMAKMIVDESVLYRGAALYAYCAARYLDEHRD